MLEETISHYLLVKELGQGGVATVYEAVDLLNKRPVALKVLFPHLASDEKVRKRFMREAQAGLELDHPGIIKVYEVGEAEDRLFIAMELIEGKTLDEVMQDKAFDVESVLDIGLQLADALACAHKRGIVHRDIKPQNILVSNGTVKLMDFGIAQIRGVITESGK